MKARITMTHFHTITLETLLLLYLVDSHLITLSYFTCIYLGVFVPKPGLLPMGIRIS